MAGCNISKKTKVNLGGKINLKFGGKSKSLGGTGQRIPAVVNRMWSYRVCGLTSAAQIPEW